MALLASPYGLRCTWPVALGTTADPSLDDDSAKTYHVIEGYHVAHFSNDAPPTPYICINITIRVPVRRHEVWFLPAYEYAVFHPSMNPIVPLHAAGVLSSVLSVDY